MTPHDPPRTRMQFILPFTTHVFNRFSRLFVEWLPAFGLLVYRGRKTGQTYRTPMNAFQRGDSYVFALTYSSDVQWVKNVMVAGECVLRKRGRVIPLVEPELFIDPQQREVPPVIRLFLRFNHVTEFLRMRIA